VSSYVMQGLIDCLVSDHREAVFLRNKFIWKIFPMINPDGVIFGNFRCTLSGQDINRQWKTPNEFLNPESFYLKNYIKNAAKSGEVFEMFIDLHGHSKKCDIFNYGCYLEEDIDSS